MNKKILILLIIPFFLTGCIKYNMDMRVYPTKTIYLSVIYAYNTNVLADAGILENDVLNKIKENGYYVSDYSNGDFEGYKFSKIIFNINKVSSTNYDHYNMKTIDGSPKNPIYFKVEKGFFKNKYTANFVSDSDGLVDDYIETENNPDGKDDSILITEETETIENEDVDAIDSSKGELLDSLDVSFSISLPYKSITNNATKVSDNGRKLTWNYSDMNMGDIEFSFYLYNPLAFLLVFGLPIIISIEILKKVRKKVYGDRRKPTVTYEEPKKNPSTFYNNQAAENELETQDKEHLDMFK